MPDEIKSTFTEVLEVRADEGLFAQELDKLTAAYNKWVDSLGTNSKDILGVGGVASFNSELKDTFETMAGLSQRTFSEIEKLGRTMLDFVERADELLNVSGDGAAKRAKDNAKVIANATEEQKKAIQEAEELDLRRTRNNAERIAQAADSAGTEDRSRLLKRVRPGEEIDAAELRAQQEFNALKEKEAEIRQRIERMRVRPGEEVEASRVAAEKELLQLTEKRTAAEDRLRKQRVRPGEEVDAAQLAAQKEFNTLKQKEADVKDRIERMRVRPGEEIEASQITAQKELAAILAKRAETEARLQRSRVRPGEQNEAAQVAALAQNEKLAATEADKLAAAITRTKAALNDLNFIKITSGKQRIEELRKQIEATNIELRKLEGQGASPSGKNSSAKLQNEYADALRKSVDLTKQLEREQAKLGKTSKSFGDNITEAGGKLLSGLGNLLRFYVLWNGINGLVNIFAEVIKAPFQLIASGVTYMQNLEKESAELISVLTANVKFSDDLATNFEKARLAAKQLTEVLEDRAITTGVPAEQLEATFRALLTGGAAKSVKTMEELVTLAEVFQLTLKASGVGALAAQGSIEEITKIFRGTGENFNKFLNGLKLGREEWTKIRDEGMKHGDLVARLKDRFEPYLKAVRETQNDQTKLVENFKLLGQRISALGGVEMFKTMSEALQRVNAWLGENRNKAAAFIKVLADGIMLVVKGIAYLTSGKNFNSFLKRELIYALQLRDTLLQALAIGTVLFTEDSKSDRLKGGTSKSQALAKAFKEIEGSRKNILQLFDSIESTPSQVEDMMKAFFEAFNQKPIVDSQVGVITSDFAKLKQEYLNDVQIIEESNKRKRNSYEELVAEQQISAAEAAVLIQRNVQGEINALIALDKVHAETVRKARLRIGGQAGGAKPEQVTAAQNELDAQALATERATQKRIQALKDTASTALKRGARETLDIQKAGLKSQLNLVQTSTEQEKELQQSAKDANYLTEVQYFDAITLLEQKTYDIRKKLLEEDLVGLGQNTTGRQNIQIQLDQLEAEHSKNQTVRSANRLNLLEQERLKLQEFGNQIRSLDLAAAVAEERLSALLNPGSGFTSILDRLFDLRGRELDIIQSQVVEQLRLARAKGEETDETRRLTAELRQLQNARTDLFQDQTQAIINGTQNGTVRRVLLQDAATFENRRLSQNSVDARQSLGSFDAANPVLNDPKLIAARENLVKQTELSARAFENFQKMVAEDIIPSTGTAVRSALREFVGPSTMLAWTKARDAVSKFAAGAEGAVSVLNNIKGLINSYQQGAQQGGVLGGVGAVGTALSSSKKMTDLFAKIPVIGQFIPAISGILEFIGPLFTAAAKRIAEDVKKSFSKTIENYQSGNANLIDTLRALEVQRTSAITRLSGTKGGKKELEGILPEFDREISSLLKAQKSIVDGFNESLSSLRLQSDALTQVSKQWEGINKQVKDYLGAGGDAAKASEFLALSLANIRKDAAAELEQSEQDAIANAIRVNDLLEQRIKLTDDFKQKEFDLINSDAIERRQAGSVTRGRELAQLRKDHAEQLAGLDSEIKKVQTRVDKEREIFNLSTELAALRRRDEELTLKALDDQIQRLRDLKSIASGIGFNPSTQAAANVSYNFDVAVTVNGGGEGDYREGADALFDQFMLRTRQVPA